MHKNLVIVGIIFGLVLGILFFNTSITREVSNVEEDGVGSFSILEWIKKLFGGLDYSPSFGGVVCEFTNIVNNEFVILAHDVDFSPNLECSCDIQDVSEVRIDSVPVVNEEKFKRTVFNTPRDVLVASDRPMSSAAWEEGEHEITTKVVCQDGRSGEASVNFRVGYEIIPDFKLDGKEFQRLAQEKTIERVDDTQNSCKFSMLGLIMTFEEDGGDIKPSEMKDYINGHFKEASELFFGEGLNLDMLAIIAQRARIGSGWDADGFAKILDVNGDYYGVAVSVYGDNYQKLINHVSVLRGIHKGKVPVFFVDALIDEGGNSNPYALGYYNSDEGFIVVIVNEEGRIHHNIEDFVYRGIDEDFDIENKVVYDTYIPETMAHEVGHAFGLGHYWKDGNLMSSGIGFSLEDFQGCMARMRCYNPVLMGGMGSNYGRNIVSGFSRECGDGALAGNIDGSDYRSKVDCGYTDCNEACKNVCGLPEGTECSCPNWNLPDDCIVRCKEMSWGEEQCENNFLELGDPFKPFYVNCDEDNPVVEEPPHQYKFDGSWGEIDRNTPYMCFAEVTDSEHPAYGVSSESERANKCRVGPRFCGDGYYDEDIEECDDSVDADGNIEYGTCYLDGEMREICNTCPQDKICRRDGEVEGGLNCICGSCDVEAGEEYCSFVNGGGDCCLTNPPPGSGEDPEVCGSQCNTCCSADKPCGQDKVGAWGCGFSPDRCGVGAGPECRDEEVFPRECPPGRYHCRGFCIPINYQCITCPPGQEQCRGDCVPEGECEERPGECDDEGEWCGEIGECMPDGCGEILP